MTKRVKPASATLHLSESRALIRRARRYCTETGTTNRVLSASCGWREYTLGSWTANTRITADQAAALTTIMDRYPDGVPEDVARAAQDALAPDWLEEERRIAALRTQAAQRRADHIAACAAAHQKRYGNGFYGRDLEEQPL